MIDVVVVDDDFMVARVNAGFVTGTPGFRVVGTAAVYGGTRTVRYMARLLAA